LGLVPIPTVAEELPLKGWTTLDALLHEAPGSPALLERGAELAPAAAAAVRPEDSGRTSLALSEKRSQDQGLTLAQGGHDTLAGSRQNDPQEGVEIAERSIPPLSGSQILVDPISFSAALALLLTGALTALVTRRMWSGLVRTEWSRISLAKDETAVVSGRRGRGEVGQRARTVAVRGAHADPMRDGEQVALAMKPFSSSEGRLGTAPAVDAVLGNSAVVLDHKTYADLQELMGPEHMARLLDRLLTQVETCLQGSDLTQDGRERLARKVHALVSASGMLGFVRLSEAARAVEQACRGDGDLESALETFQVVRRQALHHIAKLKDAA
jgi:HPt (histidine-containing phosphotransfer) domain-containing protein